MTEIFAEILQCDEGLEQTAHVMTMVRPLWRGSPLRFSKKADTLEI